MRYPKEVKEAVLQRMMAPGNEAIAVLAGEFNVTEATLYAWRREALKSGAVIPGESRSSEQWSGAAKFAVVVETASLSEADLGEYCRKKGLFPEQVSAWREQCEASFDRSSGRATASTEKAERKETQGVRSCIPSLLTHQNQEQRELGLEFNHFLLKFDAIQDLTPLIRERAQAKQAKDPAADCRARGALNCIKMIECKT